MHSSPNTTKRINIGISVTTAGEASPWSHDANQHAAFLVLLLRQMDVVGQIFLLCTEVASGVEAFERLVPDIPFVRPDEVTHHVDLVLEVGAQLPLEWLRHVRALGAKIVTVFTGSGYADLAEGALFGRDLGYNFHGTPWH